MQIGIQDLVDFDYCPYFRKLGGVPDTEFERLIKSIVNITMLRYWARRLQEGKHANDPTFLAESVFGEMVMNPHADTVKLLERLIRKSEDFDVDRFLMVGADLATRISRDVSVKITVPVLYERKGVTTALYYMIYPNDPFRKAASEFIAYSGFIPNLLFLNDDIKIDRVVLVYYMGTLDLESKVTHVDTARKRFEFLATGITRKLDYQRFGSWCSNCELHKNNKCDILRK